MTPEHDLVVQLSAWNDLQRTVEAISREDAKVRMHLGQEWWADLDKQQALQYINRKQRATLFSLDPDAVAVHDPASGIGSAQKTHPEPPAANAAQSPAPGPAASAGIAPALPSVSLMAGTVEVLEDGTVLNEEGQPFMDIHEPLRTETEGVASSKTAAVPAATAITDDYWSPAAVARRKKLRKAVLDSDSDSDCAGAEPAARQKVPTSEEEYNEPVERSLVDAPSFNAAASSKRPNGRLVRSTIISQPTAPLPEGQISGAKKAGHTSAKKTHTSRKAVAFADTAEVSDGEGTVKKVVMPTPDKDKATKDDMFAGFKRGFLTGADQGGGRKKAIILPPPPTVSAPAETPCIQVNGTAVDSNPPLPGSKPVRKSLFSQRKAEERKAESAAPAAPSITAPMQNAVVERTVPIKPQQPPRESAWAKVSKGEVMERPPAAMVAEAPKPKAQVDASDDEPLEYTDDELEDNAFDMDDAMLAREAALAYHAKRAVIGRKGLGGWTGAIGPDGEIEWDREIVPNDGDDLPRSNVVTFGERIDPAPGGDGDRSISVPTIVPAGSHMEGAIRTGKLEDGKLVIPAGQDSEDSEVDGESSENLSAFARDRLEARKKKQELLKRIAAGGWQELAEEEARQEQSQTTFKGPKGDDLPTVQATPVMMAPSSQAEAKGASAPQRVSRFKAARMAGKQQ